MVIVADFDPLVFLLLQPSKNIWFSSSSSLLKTFGFLAPPAF
jgi:hypothetical protein